MVTDEFEAVARLEALARVVIDDVHRTTPLRLAFSHAPWVFADEEGETVWGVVHLATQPPDEAADPCFGNAQDPTRMTHAVFSWDTDMGHLAPFDEMLVEVADRVSGIVQVGLWRTGLDPSWPPCPEHAGRHPLRPVREPLGEVAPTDRPVPMTATWRCSQPVIRDPSLETAYGFTKDGIDYQDAYGPTAIPIGRLAIRQGLTIAAD